MDFIAQSLDNESDDIVASNRRVLDAELTAERVAVTSRLSDATSNGRVINREGSAVVWRSGEYWVFKITPEIHDSVDREAPFLCGVHSTDLMDVDNWPDSIVKEVTWFCREVRRDLGESGWRDLDSALSTIKKSGS